jgi:RNA polymerase sigma-32 factor
MSSTALALQPSHAITVRDPWSLVPSLGNIEDYIASIHRIPIISADEELELAQQLHAQGDLQAAGKLILSHLRLVVSISRQYLGYGIAHADLIQEGNIGLMKAVKRFDPTQGVRLVSYAIHWIKAEIHDYILKNWRMVKIATTKAQRKLFFNLRSRKQALKDEACEGDETYRNSLSAAEVQTIARDLQVKPEEVRQMETRLYGGDVSLEPTPDNHAEDESMAAPIAYLADENHEPTQVLESRYRDHLSSEGLLRALSTLDARSRRIVEERWLKEQDEEGATSGASLHELASEFGVSAERIRQIEVAAMKRMRKALEQNTTAAV